MQPGTELSSSQLLNAHSPNPYTHIGNTPGLPLYLHAQTILYIYQHRLTPIYLIEGLQIFFQFL